MDECNIYKNMGFWVKIHGYGNEKSPVAVFSFSKSASGDFCFFLVRCTEIHEIFFVFQKLPMAVFAFSTFWKTANAQTPYFRNLSQNPIYRYIIFSKIILKKKKKTRGKRDMYNCILKIFLVLVTVRQNRRQKGLDSQGEAPKVEAKIGSPLGSLYPTHWF